MSSAVSVDGLEKSYNGTQAVRGISFEIATGEIFGLLGPNGAGKTTTVEILEGYRDRDSGSVEVLGVDPARGDQAWRQRIGVVLQSSAMYQTLSVAESLSLFAGYFEHPRDVDEVVRLVGLEEKRDSYVRTLSGGQQRRLDLALALVGDPELVFLDEPTTGFDPAARRAAWGTVRSLKELGKTVLLTTHYLDEAQALADRVAIIKDGAILAEGPPRELGAGAARYRVTYRGGAHVTDDPTTLLHELTAAALARGERLEELSVTRPSLEDVYLELTE
jgi:ABC-2 type transport system ATP-binding protein